MIPSIPYEFINRLRALPQPPVPASLNTPEARGAIWHVEGPLLWYWAPDWICLNPPLNDWQPIELLPVGEYVILDCSPVNCIGQIRERDGERYWVGEDEDEIVWDDEPKFFHHLPARKL